MLSSPLMSDLVRTLQSATDSTTDMDRGIRAIRAAESDLRRALDDLRIASSRIERQICVARRDRAMDDMISALHLVNAALQRQTA